MYTNEEDEKVALKFSNDELIMTRFSSPKSIMRFYKMKMVGQSRRGICALLSPTLDGEQYLPINNYWLNGKSRPHQLLEVLLVFIL